MNNMSYEEIVESWNNLADEYNQWDNLGEDEKIEYAYMLGTQDKDNWEN